MDRIPTDLDQLVALVYTAVQADERDGTGHRQTAALRDRLVAQEGIMRAAGLWKAVHLAARNRTTELKRQADAARRYHQENLKRLAAEARQHPSTPPTDFAALFPDAFEAAHMDAAGALLGTVHARGGPSPLATAVQHEAFRLACVAAFNAGVRLGVGMEV